MSFRTEAHSELDSDCNRYGNRTAKIVGSPYHPEIETAFTISEEGVSDSLSSTNVERRITRV